MLEDPFTLEFYRSPNEDEPVRRWLQERLSPDQRRAVDAALRLVLAVHGVGVCGTRYGRQLGGGLFEFRLDEDESTLTRKWDTSAPQQTLGASGRRILLRVFCHAHGSRLILLGIPALAGNSVRSRERVPDSTTSGGVNHDDAARTA